MGHNKKNKTIEKHSFYRLDIFYSYLFFSLYFFPGI